MTQAESVTVLGAGPVGAAIAKALARAGHPVTLGVRHPSARSVDQLVAELGSGGGTATPDAAIRASRSVIAAIPGTSMHGLIDAYAGELDGKIVIDATNDLSAGHASDKLSSLPYLAEKVPSALGYRAFNSIGWENMANPASATRSLTSSTPVPRPMSERPSRPSSPMSDSALSTWARDLTRTGQSTRWPRCGLRWPSANTEGGTSPFSS